MLDAEPAIAAMRRAEAPVDRTRAMQTKDPRSVV